MFMDLIREHRRGLTHDELTEKQREVLAGVAEERRTGTLTIKLTYAPRAKGEGVDVSVSIDAKPPKTEPASSIFFITPNGDLVREDPRQIDMNLREVGPSAAHRGVA